MLKIVGGVKAKKERVRATNQSEGSSSYFNAPRATKKNNILEVIAVGGT